MNIVPSLQESPAVHCRPGPVSFPQGLESGVEPEASPSPGVQNICASRFLVGTTSLYRALRGLASLPDTGPDPQAHPGQLRGPGTPSRDKTWFVDVQSLGAGGTIRRNRWSPPGGSPSPSCCPASLHPRTRSTGSGAASSMSNLGHLLIAPLWGRMLCLEQMGRRGCGQRAGFCSQT